MNVDGTDPRSITTGAEARELEPAYTQDGRQIAYTREVGASRDIYLMNAYGSGTTAVTPTPVENESSPAPSPDGHHIAYTWNQSTASPGYVPGSQPAHGIAVTDTDTGAFTQLTDSDPVTAGPITSDFAPVYSPDGTRLAFIRSGGNPAAMLSVLMVMNADGSAQQRLTGDDVNVEAAAWSPDGQRIAFEAHDRPQSGSEPTKLYLIDSGGGSPTALSGSDGAAAPAWQRRIVSVAGGCHGSTGLVVGTVGPNRLRGTGAVDVIEALSGNDIVAGYGGGDVACGDEGRDLLVGGRGSDRLFGGPGRDVLIGGKGEDILVGGPGRDRIVGGDEDEIRP
jgi:Ca2+-binding RTX toxin-like protein